MEKREQFGDGAFDDVKDADIVELIRRIDAEASGERLAAEEAEAMAAARVRQAPFWGPAAPPAGAPEQPRAEVQRRGGGAAARSTAAARGRRALSTAGAA